MTIFLSGFMGCGKTTIGKLLAHKMGLGYIDSDEYIAEREGMSIPEIFAEKGEPYFRKTEAEAIKCLGGKNYVIACGGGAMLNDYTAAYAAGIGAVIFLDVPFDVCYNRICGDENRPIVMSSTRDELLLRYNTRYPIYKKHSALHIDCNESPIICVKRIMTGLCVRN